MSSRKWFIYLISIVCIFAQNIEITVLDDETDKEIEGVFVELEGKKYISNDDGKLFIPSFIDVNSKITFKHVRYEDKEVEVRDLLSDPVVYLVAKVFKSEVLVEADKYKPRNLKVVEGKIKEIQVSKVTIENIAGLDEVIEIDNTVNVDKTLDGKTHVNVLSSEEKEVNYKIQELSLVELSKNQNLSDALIHNIISNVELNLSSENTFLANVNSYFNTDLNFRSNLLISNEEFNSSLSKTYTSGNFFALAGINGSKSLKKFNILDRDREFNFDIYSNVLKFNTFQNYKIDDSHLNHIFLYKSQENIYQENIITDYNRSYIDGLSWQSPILTVSNELIYRDREFKNYSKQSISQKIMEEQLQNKFSITKIIGSDEEGLFLKYQNLYLSNEYSERWRGTTKNYNESDTKHQLTIRKKFLPKLDEIERRTVFNLEITPAYYDGNGYMENAIFKFSMDMEFLQNIFQFYSELSFNRNPILNGQKIYFVESLKNKKTDRFSKSKNLLLGVKYEPKDWKFDLNYSSRSYNNFLYKLYSITEEFYNLEDDVDIEVFNLSTSAKLSRHFSANLSAQYLKSNNSVVFANKPELLISSSVITKYRNHEFIALGKYEADRSILKLINDVMFQTDVDNFFNLSLKYSYSKIFDYPVDVLFSVDNLLKQDKYLLNGFYTGETKFYVSLNYTLE